VSKEKPVSVYKRMETDEEFQNRLVSLGVSKWSVCDKAAKVLDDFAWTERKVQRKIVEDVS
jgi:hypothetical protein